ncbi:MAG: hypothetical protein OXC72_15830 [Roseovarius sp.]|nr:hypothetical protein [Roseovarius sp.]MCY4293208.1 hypothetical protein [Roseovarius sp.]
MFATGRFLPSPAFLAFAPLSFSSNSRYFFIKSSNELKGFLKKFLSGFAGDGLQKQELAGMTGVFHMPDKVSDMSLTHCLHW